MLAHIIVISEWLTFVMQLYNSFVRPGNLRLEMISDTGRLFHSVLVQHPAQRSPRWGLAVLLGLQNEQSETPRLRTRLHRSAGRCRMVDRASRARAVPPAHPSLQQPGESRAAPSAPVSAGEDTRLCRGFSISQGL